MPVVFLLAAADLSASGVGVPARSLRVEVSLGDQKPGRGDFVFAIYRDQGSSDPLWQATQSADVDDSGRLSVLLGSAATGGIPAGILRSGEELWVGIRRIGGVEQPRIRLSHAVLNARLGLVPNVAVIAGFHLGSISGATSIGFATTGGAWNTYLKGSSGYGFDSADLRMSLTNTKLSVLGEVESTTGGFRFPDGSLQTTSVTGVLGGDVTGTLGASVVSNVGGVSAANVASGANAANAATTASTPDAIVKRDASGSILLADGSAVGSSRRTPGQIAILQWYEASPSNATGEANTLPASPYGIAYDGAGYMWVASAPANTVARVGATATTTVLPAPLDRPYAFAFDGKNMWVTCEASASLVKLFGTGDMQVFYSTGANSGPRGIAYDGDSFFIANSYDQTLVKIRPSDGQILLTQSSATPRSVVSDGTYIWVTDEAANKVRRYNPSTLAKLGAFSVGSAPGYGMAFDGTNIWVTNRLSNNVTKLRASDGASLGTYATGTEPYGIAFDGAHVWIANFGANTVTKLRASDGAALGTFATGTNPFAVAFDGTHVWVTNQGSRNLSKF